jgi:hypothetical protein
MIAALRTLQGRFHFDVQVVDVDGDETLEKRFGELVPVLTAARDNQEHELCHYFLDEPTVTAFLQEMR